MVSRKYFALMKHCVCLCLQTEPHIVVCEIRELVKHNLPFITPNKP